MKIALWAPVARTTLIDALGEETGLDVTEAKDADGFVAALDGAQIAILPGIAHCYTSIVGAAIRASATLEWVYLISAGHEGAAAAGWADNVVFTHPDGAVSEAVAEHAVALLAALLRQLPRAIVAQTRNEWVRDQAARCTTLGGGTVLIAGLGSIGRRIAVIARGYGARVIAVSRSGAPSDVADEVFASDRLGEVIARADFIVSALPHSRATTRLFDAAMFARCKQGAFFVNVGRGGAVDQPALAAALASGQLAGAGIDVTDPEPLPAGSSLWRAPNLIITGHYAGAGDRRAGKKIADALRENLARFRAGEPLEHQIATGKDF